MTLKSIFSLTFVFLWTKSSLIASTMKLHCDYKTMKFTLKQNSTEKGFNCESHSYTDVKERGVVIDEIKSDKPDGYP